MAAPSSRLTATIARWENRHHAIRAILRAYHRQADALYWEQSPDTLGQMGRQMDRIDAIRGPLAQAVKALSDTHPEHQGLADDLAGLRDRSDAARIIDGTKIYRIDYLAYLLTGAVEELQEAVTDPAVAQTLAKHLTRPANL